MISANCLYVSQEEYDLLNQIQVLSEPWTLYSVYNKYGWMRLIASHKHVSKGDSFSEYAGMLTV